MADQHTAAGSSMSDASGGSSESTVKLNIKTLDSQIYSFHADKDMLVSSFKEKIAGEIGVPVGQQRLIFRGKVLKDDHLLSEYHVENGHTLHLVERQPSPPQPESGTSTAETTGNSGSRAHEPNAGGLRNRVGQISHSVVLGTFNVGDQGEGAAPDLSRVIGAVLNSIGIGIGHQTTINGNGVTLPGMQINAPNLPPPMSETEGMHVNAGSQIPTGNPQPGQGFTGQSLPHILQIPIGAAMPIPSLNVPIPDSLNTISEFINCMEQALSQNGYQPDQPLSNIGEQPTLELPSDARGLSSPEALSTVLRRAQQLFGGHALYALSHIAGRLEREGDSSDTAVRGQIQSESMQVGFMMHHLGALLLELGRTMCTLRMGQSPADSYVNAGPAVYISPSGSNPIMVQPSPLQASPLYGSTPATNAGNFGPVGVGNAPRNINIHIHTAVGHRTINGETDQGERVNETGSGDSGRTRELPVRNIIAAAVPSRPTVVSVASQAQPNANASQSTTESVPLATDVADLNSLIRNCVDNMRHQSQVPSERSTVENQPDGYHDACGGENGTWHHQKSVGNGVGETSQSSFGCEDRKALPHHQPSGIYHITGQKDGPSVCSATDCDSSGGETTSNLRGGLGDDEPDAAAAPLGLGLGGLETKRRNRLSKVQVKSADRGASNASATSLAPNALSSGQLPNKMSGVIEGVQSRGQSSGQPDLANAMSEVLQSPALNNLLSGVSRQTGIGSPDALRGMLQQFTQNPALINTANQMAQQMDGQDLGSMFTGLGSGQGGGFDLSRMMQQMMPIVSQALAGGPSASQPVSAMEPELPLLSNERTPSRDEQTNDFSMMLQQMMPMVSQVLGGGSSAPRPLPAADPELQLPYNERSASKHEQLSDQDSQIHLQQVAERIGSQGSADEIFHAMVESAARSYNGNVVDVENLVEELGTEDGLACDFIEMLQCDVAKRLQDSPSSSEKP